MKLHGRIPVEPLDDERLTNIERRIVAGAAERIVAPARSRRPLAFAAAMCATAAAAVIGWKLHDTTEVVAPNPPANDKVAIHTNATGSTIDIGDATIESAPDTAYVVTRPAGGVLVEMTRGKVSLSVGKRHDRPPLIVRAGVTDVVVVGTRFTVDYGDGTHAVDVRVTEGVVRVVADKLETRVAAGDHWHTDRGLVATTDPVVPPVAPADVVHLRDHATVVPDVHLRDHVAVVPDAPHVDPSAHHAAPAPIAPVAPRPRNPLVSATDPHRDLKADIISQPVEPALDIGVKDITEVMSRYRILVLGEKNEAAAAALYSMAVTQHLKLGRDGDALRSIDAYTRAYPAGKDIKAALWLRVRILCRVAIDDQCRVAAVQYRRVAGDAPAVRVADRITSQE